MFLLNENVFFPVCACKAGAGCLEEDNFTFWCVRSSISWEQYFCFLAVVSDTISKKSTLVTHQYGEDGCARYFSGVVLLVRSRKGMNPSSYYQSLIDCRSTWTKDEEKRKGKRVYFVVYSWCILFWLIYFFFEGCSFLPILMHLHKRYI